MRDVVHMAEDSSSYYGGGDDKRAAEIMADVERLVDAADADGRVPPMNRLVTDAPSASALRIRDEQWRGHVEARDRASRERIEALEARVAELERDNRDCLEAIAEYPCDRGDNCPPGVDIIDLPGMTLLGRCAPCKCREVLGIKEVPVNRGRERIAELEAEVAKLERSLDADMKPCKDCGQVPEYVSDEDVCYMCGGTGRDDIGNTCVGCVRGVKTTEQWVCGCDDGDDEGDDDWSDE
jgi:BMFP domain-containing protein YqiC